MTCALLLRRELRRIWGSAARLLVGPVSRAMGCFFDCFRVKDLDQDHQHHRHRRSRPQLSLSESKLTEAVVAKKNRLSSLFLSQDEQESPRFDEENPAISEELRDEAKFLKACGTLPETPAEIRKAFGKLKNSPPAIDPDPSTFHSWMPNTSIKKLQLDKQVNQPITPIKFGEEWGRGSVSLEQTPSSCISKIQNSGSTSVSIDKDSEAGHVKTIVNVHKNENDDLSASGSPWHFTENNQYRNKSVRFECEFDTSSSKGSSSENSCSISKKFVSLGGLSASKPSPKPTPLKISDDMQTPGTVFPANAEALGNGKTRVRSQFVYSVLNTVENVTHWEGIKEDDFGSRHTSGELKESVDRSAKATTTPEMGVKKETSSVNDLKVEASLASSLKPPPSNHDDYFPNVGTASSKIFHFGRTPGDRPIIGMVAAHWNENELSNISPKWWDGNGIPNSTNKYKEDQKVSWHATPFEERLEKALSEESSVLQKKHISENPMIFDEEGDTALSQLQTSTQSRSVVSF